MNDSQKWLLLAGTLVLGWLLYLLAPVLTPFLVAATLAYIGDPLVDRLEARRLPRTAAVTVVFLILTLAVFGLLLIVLPMLYRQLILLAAKLPVYLEWAQGVVLPWLRERTGLDIDPAALKAMLGEHWATAGGALAGVFKSLSRSGLTLLGWLANLVLIPIVTFYLLRDWDRLVERVRELFPRRIEPEIVRLTRASDEVLGAFLRGQVAVMLVLGLLYSIGLWLVGLDLALLIGMLAGTVSFVPYLGFIVGIAAAGLAALMQFQEWAPLFYVVGVFGVGQVIEGTVLTPVLLGERIGLHPVAVIFAVLAGGQLFGFFGVLLALPVAAVIVVLLRYAHEHYMRSGLYGERAGGE